MNFLTRLFMHPRQLELRRPEEFTSPLDAAQIETEVRAQVSDPESRGFMLDELRSFGPDRPLTLETVVDDAYSLREETRRTHDRGLYEYGIGAALGADMVAGFLIRRANKLADGIKPGATASLSNAL